MHMTKQNAQKQPFCAQSLIFVQIIFGFLRVFYTLEALLRKYSRSKKQKEILIFFLIFAYLFVSLSP